MPETVTCPFEVSVSLTAHVSPRCPIVDERDNYAVAVSWVPDGETFERHGLKHYLEGYSTGDSTQEELAAKVYDDLSDAAVTRLTVRVEDTRRSGMVVEVPP